MNTSFSCSEVRTPTKARADIAEFSLTSLCSSVKKPMNNNNNSYTSSYTSSNNTSNGNGNAAPTTSFAFDFKRDRERERDRETASGPVASSSSSSLPSFLSSNMDLVQSKIEYLERERVELAMQLHKRDEKDRDRKLRLEKLESLCRQGEEERARTQQEIAHERELRVRVQCELEELRAELQRVQREHAANARTETMDVWKKMTSTSRELKRCEEELSVLQNERSVMTAENNRLAQEIEELRAHTQSLQTTLSLTQTELRVSREKLQESVRDNSLAEIEREKLLSELQNVRDESESERERLLAEIESLRETVAAQESALSQHASSLTTANGGDRMEEDEGESERRERDGDSAGGERALQQQITELKKKLFESEMKRRKLHNEVQDLRGNVRVFVRCRPFLPCDRMQGENEAESESGREAGEHLVFHDDDCSLSLSLTQAAKPHSFSFDHVFRASSSQAQVYKEVSDLVQSVMDGYRVCVFSYGQTGSGKTHTMTGLKHGDERGIIPRSIEELLTQSQMLIEQGWDVSLSLSIVELYNEELRDLLTLPNAPSASALALKSNYALDNKKKEYKIVKQDGKVVVSGLSAHSLPTESLEEGLASFYKLLDVSSQARATASTGMNETSSRSHLIVMIDVAGSFQVPGKGTSRTLHGGLRLCDLAGSERLDRTNTLHDAARLKETVNINKSLSCLADVFLALSNKTPHVPYRNSKLTMLLQDCLSGDGKSLMFVNVSPTVASAQETLCSLRFANQVSQVELGKAQKHVVTTVFQSVPAPPAQTQAQTQSQAAVMSSATERPERASVAPTHAQPQTAQSVSAAQTVSQYHPALQQEPTTPRPDRVKMRSSSLNAKLLQTQFEMSFASEPSTPTATPTKAAPVAATGRLSVSQKPTAAAPAVAASTTAVGATTAAPKNSRASLCVPQSIPFAGAASSTASTTGTAAGSRGVRFSLEKNTPTRPLRPPLLHSQSLPVSAASTAAAAAMPGPLSFSVRDTVTRERDREREKDKDNKPLPVYSFLSSGVPERALGTAPKVRNLGAASRRMSVAGGKATAMAAMPTAVKENESNNSSFVSGAVPSTFISASSAWGSVGRKRDSICVDLSLSSAASTMAKRQRAFEDLPWAATTNKKSTWR